MNLNLLYIEVETANGRTAKTCKLCQENLEYVSHAKDCPGLVLEELTYEIHIYGPHRRRGYRDINHRVAGDRLEGLVELAVSYGVDSFEPTYTAHVVGDLTLSEELIRSTTERLMQRQAAIEAAERAAEAAERAAVARAVREQEYVKALAALEQDREDFTASGYARRKALIETKYGPAPTGASTSNA